MYSNYHAMKIIPFLNLSFNIYYFNFFFTIEVNMLDMKDIARPALKPGNITRLSQAINPFPPSAPIWYRLAKILILI